MSRMWSFCITQGVDSAGFSDYEDENSEGRAVEGPAKGWSCRKSVIWITEALPQRSEEAAY